MASLAKLTPRTRGESRARATRRSLARFAAIALLAFALNGCMGPPVSQHRLVSKPNMVFSDSPVFAYQSRLLQQLEPGAATSGGAQNAGCTSCR